MKKYLVLGGSGFIGRNIVRKLSEKNKIVVADLNLSDEFKFNPNISFEKLDFVNTTDFKPYLQDVDTVVHLISTVLPTDGIENINKEIQENIFPTINLLDSMVSMGIPNILFMSSGGTVYGNMNNEVISENANKLPICKYAVHKLMVEHYLHLYNIYHKLNYKIIRAANPYSSEIKQNKMQGLIPILINKVISGEDITIWGDGNNIRDYIYIDDLVDAFIALDEYHGEEKIFNVGTGKGYSINQVLTFIKEYLDIETVNVLYEKERDCDVNRNVLDISRIKECTDWHPKIGIREGIRLSVESLKQHLQ
ncbi:NAD-dependent epimerase/dehydratase family protein [Clostridium sp.]|uniref:NAD-dependent epimerase/dehydratase family protein n=1 Tax=Clostridium sp. TaxID=1506 RepID=UPI00261198B8|nr:NAD-dependent epimerase/dehydratase family protein [Clostridium sp.]